MIRSIVFDLDGTLLDTIEDLADSVNEALQSFGLPELDYPVCMKIVGKGVNNLCRTALSLSTQEIAHPPEIPVTFDEMLAAFNHSYRSRLFNKTRPYIGIPAALEKLQSEGILLSVLSNKSQKYTQELVVRNFPEIRFRHVIGDGTEFPKKPDPASLLHIMEKTGAGPDQTILIGDGETDILTAIAANILPVAVLWGFRSEEELAEAGAKIFLKDPSQVDLGFLEQVCYGK